MIIDRIKLDQSEAERQMVYLELLKEGLGSIYDVERTLRKLKKYISNNGFSNEFRFQLDVSETKLQKAHDEIRELKDGIAYLYYEISMDLDYPFSTEVEGAIERLSKVSINAYRAKSEEGIWVKRVGRRLKGFNPSPLATLERGEYEEYSISLKKVDFMDIMKSDLTRELKKSQYELYCGVYEVDLAIREAKDLLIREAKYEKLINMLYRGSEFNFLTGTEKIVNVIDSVAIITLLLAIAGPLSGLVALPTGAAAVAGGYLGVKDVVLLLNGTDVNGNPLTVKEREELIASVTTDVVLTLAAWGLTRIYKNSLANIGANSLDDVDDALKNVGGADDVIDDLYKSFDKRQFDDYIKEIEEITGRKLTQGQLDELQKALKNNDYSKLPQVDADKLRGKFNPSTRDKLILEWEQKTGQQWPTYAEDVISTKNGKVIKRAGQRYDAHHIVEISHGGDNAWWNIFPAGYPIEHQGGIHGAGSIANEIFK